MNFSFTSDQKELKESASEFARSSLNDAVEQRDKEGKFSRAGWKACAKFGLLGIMVPEQFEGLELGVLEHVAAMEGIGQGCRDNGLIFSVNAHILTGVLPILHQGSEHLKDVYLQRLVSGEFIAANAMTEADSGSSVYALRTSAKKEKDYYVLNGSKTFVTNAPVADVFIVYAVTDPSKGFFGLSCFLVDKETEGLFVGKKIDKMGLRTSPMSEVGFSNCKVPEKHIIGRQGSGGILFSSSMEWERGLILANAVGIMERQLDECLEYIKIRKPGGQAISEHQSIAHKLADMKVRLETSRLQLYQLAWLKSEGRNGASESSIAKLAIRDAYIKNCRDAMQIHGGYGYMVEYQVERELRDALASTLYSGTSEIQKNIISSLLL